MRNLIKNLTSICLSVCLSLSVFLFDSKAAQKAVSITVAAGKLDRHESLVTFPLPKGLRAKAFELRDDKGRRIPLQVDAEGNATFVLAELKSGETKRYRIEAVKAGKSPTPSGGVQLTKEGNRLLINSAGRQVLAYQTQPGELPGADIKPIFKRGGYIHPVYTPSGRSVTDDFPADHRHHHGIWWAWTKTEFEGRRPDFWNVADGTGKVEFVAVDGTWSGEVHGGFKARTRSVDVSAPKPVTVLNEEWQVTVYRVGQEKNAYSMFDLVSTQACATTSPLVLPEYRYGGLGFRGHREWLDKNNCFFLTSEGKERANGNGTRARWCHIGGRIGGEFAGIAILDHPSNFRAPQPVRLNPDQPFFCYAPSVLGLWEIARGQQYVSRYRFVVYDGQPDVAQLNRLWEDYANPPEVSVTGK
jgi:hypothetical protein